MTTKAFKITEEIKNRICLLIEQENKIDGFYLTLSELNKLRSIIEDFLNKKENELKEK